MVEWRDRIERIIPSLKYGQPVSVFTAPLSTLLKDVPTIDFLTVDCEGMDLDVLRSLDWTRHRPQLVCAESGAGLGTDAELFHFLADVGYVYHAHTLGNTFWRQI